jgi:hypothetical protein
MFQITSSGAALCPSELNHSRIRPKVVGPEPEPDEYLLLREDMVEAVIDDTWAEDRGGELLESHMRIT